MLKDKTLIPVWSNFPFLIPAALAFYKGLPIYGLLITVATIISYIHHTKGGNIIKRVDQFLALSVISANLYVLYLAGFPPLNFGVALLFVALAFYFFFKGKDHKYDVYHGLWHLCSVVITILCVLAY